MKDLKAKAAQLEKRLETKLKERTKKMQAAFQMKLCERRDDWKASVKRDMMEQFELKL